MFELIKHQDDFLYSDAEFTGLVGGYGCGKTYIGILKTVSMKLKYPNIPVAYYLPTYPLVRDIAFKNFTQILDELNVPNELKTTDKVITTPYGDIIMRSMDNPDLIVGYEVGYSLIDEADVLPKKKMDNVFDKVLGRNRFVLPGGDINKLDFVSTPEGFKFLYDFFVVKIDDTKRLIKGKTLDNPYVPKNYVKTLMQKYSKQKIKAYLEGEFINLTSYNVYHHYDMFKNHKEYNLLPNDALHIGMDFNVTKMSAAISVIKEGIIYVIDEVFNGYDTNDVINIIKSRYPKRNITIYPDASGKSRGTSGVSDINLLQGAGFTIRMNKSNSKVDDRINIVNLAFKDNFGNTKLYIDKNKCSNLSNCVMMQIYNNGVPDKSLGFDHSNDALGYLVYMHNHLGKETSLQV